MCRIENTVDRPAEDGNAVEALGAFVAFVAAGAPWGAFFDMVNGGLDDPIGDGALKGAIVGAVCFVLIAVGVGVVVAVRNRRAAAGRRKRDRRARQSPEA
ncbi:hypothetical protein AB0C69_39505 [Actinomadura sp. NPDC048032]|uniref:hypothetical protein n=1 Tax=Actinomadura sp. NPDC048032 TaxID=3155747 RepID=UPI0033FE47D4